MMRTLHSLMACGLVIGIGCGGGEPNSKSDTANSARTLNEAVDEAVGKEKPTVRAVWPAGNAAQAERAVVGEGIRLYYFRRDAEKGWSLSGRSVVQGPSRNAAIRWIGILQNGRGCFTATETAPGRLNYHPFVLADSQIRAGALDADEADRHDIVDQMTRFLADYAPRRAADQNLRMAENIVRLFLGGGKQPGKNNGNTNK